MPDTTHQIKVSGSDVVNTTVFPDTKLQTLDRRVGKDQLYFDRKLFEVSVDDWNGIPVIYQPDGIHPTDFAMVTKDPFSAAESIGGKVIGTVSNPRVVVPGGPRLMAQLNIDGSEQEIVKEWQQGIIFPSTAFMANSDGDRLTSPPIPNHVLLFPAKVDEVLPGDLGAFVNTLEVQSTMNEETDEKMIGSAEDTGEPSGLDDLRAEMHSLKCEVAEIRDRMVNTVTETAAAAEVARSLDDEIRWRDETIAGLKAEVEALTAGKAVLEEKIAAMESAAMEAEFNSIVEKLPVGMKSTPEQIELLHTQYAAGNLKDMLVAVLNTNAQSGTTQKVGQPFTRQLNTHAEPLGVGDLNKPGNREE